MKRRSKPELEKFRADVMAAFTTLAPVAPGIARWDAREWQSLILSRGWVCPAWPTDWGGAGWSSAEKFIWYQACHASFDDYQEPPEIADVGPALGRWGNARAHAELANIAALGRPWSLALFEEGFSGADLQTQFKQGLLEGQKVSVRYLGRAERILVVAKHGSEFVLLSVAVDAPGVSVRQSTSLSGLDEFARVDFVGVKISPDEVLGRLASRVALQALCQQVVGLELGRSGVLIKQLERLSKMPDIDRDDTRLAALEVSVRALAALEARVVSARQSDTQPPVPWSLLQARSLALQLEVGEALVDSFGYYAMPFPDPVSLHNEGRIGPEESYAATYAMLRATEQVNYANLAGDLYDIAAREWLTPDNGKSG